MSCRHAKLMGHSTVTVSQKSLQWGLEQKQNRNKFVVFYHARVAKLADAKDLKSFFRQRECGFKSRPGHQHFCN
jgi:hypothetical protein